MVKKKKDPFKGRIIGWSNGSDPSKFGWVIDGSNYNAYTIGYEWQDWEDIPIADDIITKMKEDIKPPYSPPFGMLLLDWFSAHQTR